MYELYCVGWLKMKMKKLSRRQSKDRSIGLYIPNCQVVLL